VVETVCSSETLVSTYKSTRRYSPNTNIDLMFVYIPIKVLCIYFCIYNPSIFCLFQQLLIYFSLSFSFLISFSKIIVIYFATIREKADVSEIIMNCKTL
jgi:hypothetical protein